MAIIFISAGSCDKAKDSYSSFAPVCLRLQILKLGHVEFCIAFGLLDCEITLMIDVTIMPRLDSPFDYMPPRISAHHRYSSNILSALLRHCGVPIIRPCIFHRGVDRLHYFLHDCNQKQNAPFIALYDTIRRHDIHAFFIRKKFIRQYGSSRKSLMKIVRKSRGSISKIKCFYRPNIDISSLLHSKC